MASRDASNHPEILKRSRRSSAVAIFFAGAMWQYGDHIEVHEPACLPTSHRRPVRHVLSSRYPYEGKQEGLLYLELSKFTSLLDA